MEKFDIVIIGAGLGGLSSAAYLAKAGKKILVLEHHAVPGGYAHEFRRGKYRFEVALHALDGAAPGGWAYPVLKDLGVLDRVHFHRMDPFYTVRFPNHEVAASADMIEYEAELIRHFPAEKENIRTLIAEMIETFFQVRRFGADGEIGQRPPIEQMPAVYPKMLSAMSQSWDEFMSQFTQNQQLKAVLSTLWGYYGLPPAQLNAATYIFPWVSYHLYGAYYPEGGSMAMSRAIEKTIKENGGEIRYHQTVNKIEIQKGRAVAVEIEKGLRVEADVFISNANSPDTLLKFVGRENLPQQYADQIESAAPSISNFVLYLGLDRNLKSEGWKHHELFVSEGYDIDADYQAALDGKFNLTALALTNYDQVDASCAPETGSVLSIFSLADWKTDNVWGTGGSLKKYSDNPKYNELKEAAAERILDRAEKIIPGLRASIKYKEIATPITNWRYSRNVGGAIYGTEQTVENMYSGRLQSKTPIENLFLTGAWTFGGGMSAALMSGRETSRMVIGFIDGSEVILMTAPSLGSEQVGVNSDKFAISSDQLPITNPQSVVSNHQLPIIKAAGSDREITLNKIGKPAVLIFHTQETAEVAAKINETIRAESNYANCDSIFIANVVDLHSVPKLFRGFAEKAMKESYAKAAASLAKGLNPQDYIVIIPDWDGSVTKSSGFKNTNKTAAFAALDKNGNLTGSYQGENPESAALALLKMSA